MRRRRRRRAFSRENSLSMMETGLNGKCGIVAGGASGIGRGIAAALEAEGAAVAVVDRQESDVGQVRIRTELGEPSASAKAVSEAAHELGGLDFVVYSAAIAKHEPIGRLSARALDATFASNLAGCVWTSREAARLIVGKGGGSILVVGSTTIYTPVVGEAAYRMSKAALKAFVELFAIELAPECVRVNLLTPGAVATPLTQGMTSAQRTALIREIPLKREAVVHELTSTALLLLSDRLSPYTTGAEFVVDGGIHLRPMPGLHG